MTTIRSIRALEVLDSRGNPTIETSIELENGLVATAMVPSGASTGKHEAVELRDHDRSRYNGKGVRTAVNNVEQRIGPALKGMDATDQGAIDQRMLELDGTPNKADLGANAILGVSLAAARASALIQRLPLYETINPGGEYRMPVPMMNILNGGAHADNGIDFQEFMVMPVKADSFSDALRMGVEVFHHLKAVLKARGMTTNVGDEGGFAPELESNTAAMEAVLEAIGRAGFAAGEDIFVALDVASTEFYREAEGVYELSSGSRFSAEELIGHYAEWCAKYPIISIEDGLAEDDWNGWAKLTETIGEQVQLVGDDLYVTNTNRLKRGIEEKSGNAILVKVNQIGTLSETIEAVELARRNQMNAVISHRSGETEDHFIADLAVALGTGQIKTGSASRSDRMAKYNRLLRIESELGAKAIYPGKDFRVQKGSKVLAF